MKEDTKDIVGATALVVVVIAAIALLVSLPVMWLWNWLMPDIFGLKQITWMQALGLALLCGLLFNTSSK